MNKIKLGSALVVGISLKRSELLVHYGVTFRLSTAVTLMLFSSPEPKAHKVSL